jgi:DNA-binding transcriptional LysR family regulator
MELRQLRYFVALAEELNFSRAARRLHISQPPLTRQIHQLEEELGVDLLYRTTRKVELTDAGQSFANEARQIIARIAHAAGLASQANRGIVGHLVVGYTPSRLHILARAVKSFTEKYPSVRLELHDISGHYTELIRDGRVDVGFVPIPVDSTGLVVETILREPFVVAMPKTNPLAKKNRVSMSELAGEPNLLFPRRMDPAGYDLIVGLCQRRNLTMNVVMEVENIHTRIALVGAGFGVCVVRASARGFLGNDVVFRALQASPLVAVGIAYSRENRSHALPLFVDIVRQVIRHHFTVPD